MKKNKKQLKKPHPANKAAPATKAGTPKSIAGTTKSSVANGQAPGKEGIWRGTANMHNHDTGNMSEMARFTNPKG